MGCSASSTIINTESRESLCSAGSKDVKTRLQTKPTYPEVVNKDEPQGGSMGVSGKKSSHREFIDPPGMPSSVGNVTLNLSPTNENPVLDDLNNKLQLISEDMKFADNEYISTHFANKKKKIHAKIQFYLNMKSTKMIPMLQNDTHGSKPTINRKSTCDTELEKLICDTILGNISVDCPSNVKIVRIFTSSTFTDTKHERNYLMENTYPKLKTFCQQKGFQFQIVDMRWGIRDGATNDHMTTDLCMKELKLCQKLSTGPNFVTFLSHKYGYQPCPRTISKEIFEKFLSVTELPKEQVVMYRWYKEDRNSLKASYLLQPIGEILHDFLSQNEENKLKAKDQWYKESSNLRAIINSAAKHSLSEDDARVFYMSVTETEILHGILEANKPENHCIWFKRNILDIEKQKYDKYMSYFRECPTISEGFKESQDLLRILKDDKIPSVLNNILTYNIKWSPKGVDPEASQEHRRYLKNLADDFEQRTKDLIEKAIATKSRIALNDLLYEEVKQHTLFCQKKCQSFCGRTDLLPKIRMYIARKIKQPLVIYGKSGCGKTSVLAMAAKKVLEWTEGKAAVVLRFLGTTLASSDANSLMTSITQQIQYIYSYSQPMTSNKKAIEKQFHESLQKSSADCPLVLILDSLDQLSVMGGGRQLSWLLRNQLPDYTKVILSTLPEEEYLCFPKLQAWINDEEQLLEVPRLPHNDVSSIVGFWLRDNGRTLTESQKNIILEAFESCPLPLFLKLSIDVACEWHSYSAETTTVLERTVRDSIRSLFVRLENRHGSLLVSKALGYLTLAENGLSESELEDILSCDEEVLNDVYIYWTPPIRRLPPLLWVRIKNDLEEYLVERGSDGIQVMCWYHRQFIEVAKERYCSDPGVRKLLYQGLIDFFSGTWSNGNLKPYIDRKGQSGKSDRLVTLQPLKFDSQPNLRKLNSLPDLMIKAQMLSRLKEEVLLNHEFLLTKLQATSVMEVLNDFSLALEMFPKEQALQTIAEAIQLSQNALDYDQNQLTAQLIGRLPNIPALEPILQTCRRSSAAYLEADQKVFVLPGGQLVHCIPAHKTKIVSFDITSDKRMAVTLCNEGLVRFWDISKGHPISTFDDCEGESEKVQFCCNDKLVALNPGKQIIFVCTETASLSQTTVEVESMGEHGVFAEEPFFEVCGRGKTLIAFHCMKFIFIWDICTSKVKHKMELPLDREDEINSTIPSAGTEDHFAVPIMGYPLQILVMYLQTGCVKCLEIETLTKISGDCIDALALCPYGQILYFTSSENNILYCYDLKKEEIVKQLPGNRNDICEKFHMSTDGQAIYFFTRETLKVWDLNQSECSEVVVQSCFLTDFGMVSKTFAVTVSDDGNLRMWDLTRSYIPLQTKENRYKNIRDGSIRQMLCLQNGRYVIFRIGFEPFYWYIYDVSSGEVIMELKLVNGGKAAALLSDTLLAVVTKMDRLKLVDLQTCTVSLAFAEKIKIAHFLPIKNGNEILAVSKSNKLMVYDTQTGSCQIIIGINERISNFCANNSGTIAVAFTEEDTVYIVDLVNYEIFQTLSLADIGVYSTLLSNANANQQVSNDGTTVIFLGNGPVNSEKNYDIVFYTIVWNIPKGTVQCKMFDQEYYEIYIQQGSQGISVESATFLQNDRVVLSDHEDHIIRVFSADSGKLLHRLEQHNGCLQMVFSPNSSLPYFLSWGYSNEELAFCLWRKDTFQKVATIKLDDKPSTVSLSANGQVICGRSSKKGFPITVWTLYNGPSDCTIASFEEHIESFQKQGFGNILDIMEDDYKSQGL